MTHSRVHADDQAKRDETEAYWRSRLSEEIYAEAERLRDLFGQVQQGKFGEAVVDLLQGVATTVGQGPIRIDQASEPAPTVIVTHKIGQVGHVPDSVTEMKDHGGRTWVRRGHDNRGGSWQRLTDSGKRVGPSQTFAFVVNNAGPVTWEWPAPVEPKRPVNMLARKGHTHVITRDPDRPAGHVQKVKDGQGREWRRLNGVDDRPTRRWLMIGTSGRDNALTFIQLVDQHGDITWVE